MLRKARRAHAELGHGRRQEALACGVQRAVLAYLRGPHVRVAQQRHIAIRAADSALEALALDLTRLFDAGTDVGARFAQPIIGELLIVHARHFDVDVDLAEREAARCGRAGGRNLACGSG
jgi:hypothetical protein